MATRSTRGTLLAAASGAGAVFAALQLAARAIEFSDAQSSYVPTYYKVSTGLDVLAAALALIAFGEAVLGFREGERARRARMLIVSSGLFAAYGAAAAAAGLIPTLESESHAPFWEITASGWAGTGAGIALAVAGVLAAGAFRSVRSNTFFGRASVGLGAHFGLVAAAYGFELAGLMRLGVLPGTAAGGLGASAGGEALAAVGALVAAIAFLAAASRAARGDACVARREASLGTAALVFAFGFLVGTVGLMLYVGAGGGSTVGWLEAVSQLFLLVTGLCAAAAFARSSLDHAS